MTKEIETSKHEIAKLEKELNSILAPFRDNGDTRAKLAKKRVLLAKLYKKNKQVSSALHQLQLAFEYYNNPSNQEKHHNSIEPLLEIFMLQVKCYKSNSEIEKQRISLSELLTQLPFAKIQENIKKIPHYLEDYIQLSSGEEALEKINYILSKSDKNCYPDSYNYRDTLNIKAKTLCSMGQFKEAYETYLDLLKQYDRLKSNRSSSVKLPFTQDEKLTYLHAFSLAKLNNYPISEVLTDIVSQIYQRNKYYFSDYKVTFEGSQNPHDGESLQQMILLYKSFNVEPPVWFPAHTIQTINNSAYFVERYDDSVVRTRKNRVEKPVEVELLPVVPVVPQEPEHLRIKQKLTDDWSVLGVGGYQEVIDELNQKIFKPRSLSPERRNDIGLENLPAGGIIAGPPGTGKTLIVRTLAEHFIKKQNVFVINGPELISKFVGESAENFRKILEPIILNPNETFVIIFDEIESLLGARNSTDEGLIKQIKSDLTTTLLTYLDGVHRLENLIVFGTTNYPERLDQALLRSGRLDVHFYVNLPTEEERLAIIKVHTKKAKKYLSPDLDFDFLAKHSEGLSGADIKSAINYAKIKFNDINWENFENESPITLMSTELLQSCLKEKIDEKKQSQTEQQVLSSRPFCEFSQAIVKASISVRKKAEKSAYLRPMLFNISGDSATGASSLALNLFPEAKKEAVYIKTGELVGLSGKEQEKYLDERFNQALSKANGVLIIDDLEDMKSCPSKPLIYLKNKLKMALPEGKKLNVILVAKQEDTANKLFNGQLLFNSTIKMPFISKTAEVIKVIEALSLYMDRNEQDTELKLEIPIGELHTQLLTYCKKTPIGERNLNQFIGKLNAKVQSLNYAVNPNALFIGKRTDNGQDSFSNPSNALC